jgi:glutathione synthase/RimK-type ligase-like ATP-grasp enzyme
MIAACGFSVPDTLVTTDAVAVGRFLRRHHDVIYKSTSGVRSIVSRLGPTRRDALEDVANCPTQFQEYVPGVDIRVHVVGDDILATEICSKADDYRYASRSNLDVAMVPIVLPEKVAAACRAMVNSMGLNVAGIDLRRTPDDKWYCFEVNPSPGFTFFEAAAGQPIAATIADFLLRHGGGGDPARFRRLNPVELIVRCPRFLGPVNERIVIPECLAQASPEAMNTTFCRHFSRPF